VVYQELTGGWKKFKKKDEMDKNKNFRLFVIGASAGGFKAIVKCLDGFQSDADAAFVVVLHSPSELPEIMSAHLEKLIKMPVSYAQNHHEIKIGQVFLARPNVHLMVENGSLLFSHGPKENLFRPSIDVLFRSAAVAYGHRAVGILLTGRLNDGALGLLAIKRCGGITIIQDPNSAEFTDMPLYALKTVDPDYVLKLDEMPMLFNKLLENPLPPQIKIPATLQREVDITKRVGNLLETDNEINENLSCPSCGGPLSQIDDENGEHYRCRIGHSFNIKSLDESQNQQLEESLWIAFRVLDERRMLLKKMISDYERKGMDFLAENTEIKLEEVENHVRRLKAMMGLVE
jgi:two-component system, chemotaxis family, protein-glutamate methylesterase/glutaminase